VTDIAIVGGGPAGATLALCLARLGHSVEVYERSAFARLFSTHPALDARIARLRIGG